MRFALATITCLIFLSLTAPNLLAQQPAPQTVPQLACAGGTQLQPDPVELHLDAECSTSDGVVHDRSVYVTAWQNGLTANAPIYCSLVSKASTAVMTASNSCSALPDGGARVTLSSSAQAFAGYQYRANCAYGGGNYCGSVASSGGYTSTFFVVNAAQAGHTCVGVVNYAQNTWGEREDSYSGHFSVGNIPLSQPQIKKPNGVLLTVASGNAYPLDMQGAWQITIPLNYHFGSNMAENSGTVYTNQDLVLQFAAAKPNGTCPTPQLSAAALAALGSHPRVAAQGRRQSARP